MGALAVMAVMAVVAAGCGSSGSSSSDTSSSASSSTTASAGASAGVAKAKAQVAILEKTSGIQFPKPPQTPYDVGTGRASVIVCGTAGAGCLGMGRQTREALIAAGWKPTQLGDGKFTPAVQSGLILQAIQQKFDVIVLVSIDAASIKAAIDAANKAKIPISCVACVSEPEFQGKVYDSTTGGAADGEAIGNWIVADSNGKAKTIAYDDTAFPIIKARQDATKKVFDELCPECTWKISDFPTSDLTKPGPPTFTATLAANPKGSFEYMATPSDTFAIPMVKTADQQGRTEIKFTGFDGEGAFVQQIKAAVGKPGGAKATAYSPFPYMAWSAVDQVLRIHAGEQPWDTTKMPITLVDDKNVDTFASVTGYWSPEDFDFRAMFKKLWGK
jgi:ABC-type sugar transport system substrate-binding protein